MSVEREQHKDPVAISPQIYSVLLENDRVRVLDIRLKPGAKSPMHSHPTYLIYSLSAGKTKFTFPDGTSRVIDLKPGHVVWSEAESHAAENVGDSELHVINVEMKG